MIREVFSSILSAKGTVSLVSWLIFAIFVRLACGGGEKQGSFFIYVAAFSAKF